MPIRDESTLSSDLYLRKKACILFRGMHDARQAQTKNPGKEIKNSLNQGWTSIGVASSDKVLLKRSLLYWVMGLLNDRL